MGGKSASVQTWLWLLHRCAERH